MINLLKADLYRLFHGKAYKNSFIATVLIGVGIIFLGKMWFMSYTDSNGITYGFRVGVEAGANYLEFIKGSLGSSIVMYIVGVSLTTTVITERVTKGTFKNIVSYGYARWKVITSIIFSLIIGMAILITINLTIILGLYSILEKPTGISMELILLTIKTLITYILICGAGISVYAVIVLVLPSASIVSVLLMTEVLFFTMAGHLLPKAYTNFAPVLILREISSYPEKFNLVAIMIWMIFLIGCVIDIGRMIFNRMEIR